MNLCYEHRLNAQLEGISHCLKTLLTSSTDSRWEYVDNSSIPDPSNNFSGHLIGVDQCLTLRLNNGAWLKVAPLAPGGLICDDLLVQSDCQSFSTLQSVIKGSSFNAESACTMTSEQFHSRFRPDSQGHSLQSDRATHRLLVMMPDVTDSNRDNLPVEKIGSLLDTLITSPGLTSIECLYTDTFGATKCRELLTLLKNRFPALSRLGMIAVNPDRQNLLSVLMGNASLALCGHSGNVADAFQFGLPVALWNCTGSLTTDSINCHSLEWFRQGCQSSKSMTMRQQQETWLRVLTRNSSAITIANKSSYLRHIIEKWLVHRSDPGTTQKISLGGPQASRPRIEWHSHGVDLIIPSAFSPIAIPGKLEQLRTSLERKHRKFVKFRHSPIRFIEDSEARWLRAFKHLRS